MGQTAATAITQAHFEIHVLQSDRWVIDYVSTSREDALEEAGELVRRPEIAGVRVVKELFNPETETSAARILFEHLRDDRLDGRRRPRLATPRPVAVSRKEAGQAPPVRRPPPAAEPEEEEEGFSWLSLAGLSVIGAVAGGGLTVLLAFLTGS